MLVVEYSIYQAHGFVIYKYSGIIGIIRDKAIQYYLKYLSRADIEVDNYYEADSYKSVKYTVEVA